MVNHNVMSKIPFELRDKSMSTMLDRLLVRAGVLTMRITPDAPIEYHWAWGLFFRKFITFFVMFAMIQGILFDTKNAYADQLFSKSSSGEAAVYGNQRVMGSGESDLTRNNLGSVLLRTKSGRTTNQSFDMSHGSAVVWGRYIPDVGRGRIDVTYMEKNPVTGDVRLVEKVVGPDDFQRSPVDKIPDNGVRKYFTNKAGQKFNPLEQFSSSYNNRWGGGNNQLYDISFGAMTAVMGLVAKRYNANRGYVIFGQFWQEQSKGRKCCCVLCACKNPWFQLNAGIHGNWHILTSLDNASATSHQSYYHIRGTDGDGTTPKTTPNTTPTNRCISEPALVDGVPSPVVSNPLTKDSPPRLGFDELGSATLENEYDRDACVVRGSMNLVSPTVGADFDNGKYEYWVKRKYYGCGLPFILVVIIAIIAVIVTYGAALSAVSTTGLSMASAITSTAAVTAGLVAGGMMTLAHLINGGSLMDQVSLDQAGSMILGAAIGGFIGGSGLFADMVNGLANNFADMVGLPTQGASPLNVQVATTNSVGSGAFYSPSTSGVNSILSATSYGSGASTAFGFVDNQFVFGFGASGSSIVLPLVETTGVVTNFASAMANDPDGMLSKKVHDFGKGMLTGLGMSESEALSLFPNLPTNTTPLMYGKWVANPPTTSGEDLIWEYRPAVLSCFMDPPIQSSNTSGANNGCLGSASATWSVYRVNRQCNPGAAANDSDSCEKRYTQFSDVLMMKMGAVLQTEEQIINNDLSTDRTGTADDEPMIYLPRSGGGRPVMYPGSRGSIPEGPVE